MEDSFYCYWCFDKTFMPRCKWIFCVSILTIIRCTVHSCVQRMTIINWSVHWRPCAATPLRRFKPELHLFAHSIQHRPTTAIYWGVSLFDFITWQLSRRQREGELKIRGTSVDESVFDRQRGRMDLAKVQRNHIRVSCSYFWSNSNFHPNATIVLCRVTLSIQNHLCYGEGTSSVNEIVRCVCHFWHLSSYFLC